MNKLYLIIITNALTASLDEIRAVFGCVDLNPVKTVDLFDAGLISGICIGKYHDKVVISDKKKVFDFFCEHLSVYEKHLCDLFPKSEILILYLYSVIDGYGFSIIRKGKRERIKWASDDAVYYDFGTKTIEEAAVDDSYPVDDSHAGRLTVDYLLEKYLGNENSWCDIELVQYG